MGLLDVKEDSLDNQQAPTLSQHSPPRGVARASMLNLGGLADLEPGNGENWSC